jgi:tetratricopeptide (TPR) repeat protein
LSDQPSTDYSQPTDSTPQESHPLDNQPLENPAVPVIPAAPGEPSDPTPDQLTPRPEPETQAKTKGFPKPETASFAGITPGESTIDQVEKAWGNPAEVVRQDGVSVHRYKIKPFERIEVVFKGNRVMTIIVRLEDSLPADKLAKELRINDISPVFVSGELGEILGQAFPERGVLFAFDQNAPTTDGPANPVSEIVLEPLGPDPFVLRAESRLDSHFEENLHDLELAIQLSPNHARAQWLYSRVLCAVGRTKDAVAAIRKAIQAEEKNAQYRITYAQILDQLGDQVGASKQAAAAVEYSKKYPHIQGRALCLLGDLFNASPTPDMGKALKYHMAAIKTVEPILSNRHPAVRKIAKEVAIDAHLGAASDIAWGKWSNKGKAVDRWTALAAAFAEELIANDGGTDEHRFRVATRSLASYVGAEGALDPTEWAEEAVRVGQRLIDQAVDPIVRQQLSWETGMAVFNAVQVCQARKDQEASLRYGEIASKYLTAGLLENEPEQSYLLGRLQFRLGTIHALTKNDHATAVTYYEQAVKFFQQPVPNQDPLEVGRQGEAYVSMGVSFWETGRQDEAIEMTKQGAEFVKQAVEAGAMPRSALIVPFENLANMQRYQGQASAAAKSQKIADMLRKSQTQSANKPTGKTQR